MKHTTWIAHPHDRILRLPLQVMGVRNSMDDLGRILFKLFGIGKPRALQSLTARALSRSFSSRN